MNILKHFRYLLLLTLLPLSACMHVPERLDFASDGHVLRGVYEGMGTSGGGEVAADEPMLSIRMDVVPDYVAGNLYVVTGTLTLGEQGPIPFEGKVLGRNSEVYVLTSLPPPAEFEARFNYSGEVWGIKGYQIAAGGEGSRRVPWSIQLGPVPEEYLVGEYVAELVPTE